MSFTTTTKKKIPTEDETRIKFLSIAYNIHCYDTVKALFKKFDGLSLKYKNNPQARVDLVEDLILNMSKIDPRLVGWLIDENGQILVNGRVVLELRDDSQMKGIY
jgi:hypothetical protein